MSCNEMPEHLYPKIHSWVPHCRADKYIPASQSARRKNCDFGERRDETENVCKSSQLICPRSFLKACGRLSVFTIPRNAVRYRCLVLAITVAAAAAAVGGPVYVFGCRRSEQALFFGRYKRRCWLVLKLLFSQLFDCFMMGRGIVKIERRGVVFGTVDGRKLVCGCRQATQTL